MPLTNVQLDFYASFVMLFVLMGCCMEYKTDRKRTSLFMGMASSAMVMLLSNGVYWLLADRECSLMLQRVSVAISFIAFYAAMLLFISYTTACIYLHVPSVSWLPVHVSFVVCVAFSVLWIISIFNDMFFVTEGGRIVPGALGRLGQSGGYIVTVFVVLIIVCHIKKIMVPRASGLLLLWVLAKEKQTMKQVLKEKHYVGS